VEGKFFAGTRTGGFNKKTRHTTIYRVPVYSLSLGSMSVSHRSPIHGEGETELPGVRDTSKVYRQGYERSRVAENVEALLGR